MTVPAEEAPANYVPAAAEEALRALGLPPAVRGEALSLEQFAALSELLRKQERND